MEFEVDVIRKVTYTFSVDAENAEDAKAKAYLMYEKLLDKGTLNEYLYDEDTDVEVGDYYED